MCGSSSEGNLNIESFVSGDQRLTAVTAARLQPAPHTRRRLATTPYTAATDDRNLKQRVEWSVPSTKSRHTPPTLPLTKTPS